MSAISSPFCPELSEDIGRLGNSSHSREDQVGQTTTNKRKTDMQLASTSKRTRDDSNIPLSSADVSPSSRENSIELRIDRICRDYFEAKYQILEPLGQGGYGSVYAGIRKRDQLPVALKYIQKTKALMMVSVGRRCLIPLEVLLMTRISGIPGSGVKSAAVSLIEWYNLDKEIVLIMERPVPAIDLSTYIQSNGGKLDDGKAKVIIKQLVEASIEMHSKDVFHQDLKVENVLIQTTSDGPRVKIIDFGCACLANRPQSTYSGTYSFAPPEYFLHKTYEAGPATVWQLGALLFNMVDGDTSFNTSDFILKNIEISDELSHECRLLLLMCLAINPKHRATLQKLQQHAWFT